jgi:hypothetical protein
MTMYLTTDNVQMLNAVGEPDIFTRHPHSSRIHRRSPILQHLRPSRGRCDTPAP